MFGGAGTWRWQRGVRRRMQLLQTYARIHEIATRRKYVDPQDARAIRELVDAFLGGGGEDGRKSARALLRTAAIEDDDRRLRCLTALVEVCGLFDAEVMLDALAANRPESFVVLAIAMPRSCAEHLAATTLPEWARTGAHPELVPLLRTALAHKLDPWGSPGRLR